MSLGQMEEAKEERKFAFQPDCINCTKKNKKLRNAQLRLEELEADSIELQKELLKCWEAAPRLASPQPEPAKIESAEPNQVRQEIKFRELLNDTINAKLHY